MKKIIRLTENDLHKIVKNVLTELDWKTYANAARERWNQYQEEPNNSEKYKNFMDLQMAAMRNFRDQNIDNKPKSNRKKSPIIDVSTFDLSNDNKVSPVVAYDKNSELFSNSKDKLYKRDYDTTDKVRTNADDFFTNKKDKQNYLDAHNEFWDYMDGNYEYDSVKNGGEGKWKKKNKNQYN